MHKENHVKKLIILNERVTVDNITTQLHLSFEIELLYEVPILILRKDTFLYVALNKQRINHKLL